MKKYFILILGLLLAGMLTGCGNVDSAGNPTEETVATQPVDNTEASEEESTDSDNSSMSGKSLVVYFAYSENVGDTSGMAVDAITSASLNRDTDNTEGNLQIMAQVIEEKKGADIFHILMTEPYDMDYSTMLPTAIEQMDSGELPALQEHIDDLNKYDVIYIGTPVWNSELPPALLSFFDEYDLSGKTIVPFGIHLGSV